MKHKVSELEGALLDAAVAKAEGHKVRIGPGGEWDKTPTCWMETEAHYVTELHPPSGAYSPSSEWAHGGPIIEREQIATLPQVFQIVIEKRGGPMFGEPCFPAEIAQPSLDPPH